MIGGQKSQGFAKKIGIAKFEVIAFCPDKEEREALYGTTLDKEPNYLKTDEQGITNFNVSVILKELSTGTLYDHIIFLKDTQVVSKDGNKYQYLNEIGRSTYADSEENLTEKFSAYPYHIARGGEADLIDFLDAWLDIDRRRPYSLEVDWKKLMSGSVKELTDLLNTDLPREIVGMSVIRVKKKEGEEIKEYQGTYRKFLPGYTYSYFRTKTENGTKEIDGKLVDSLKLQKESQKETKKWLKNYESFLADINDNEYGCKDIYYNGLLKDYDGERLPSKEDVIVQEEDSSY